MKNTFKKGVCLPFGSSVNTFGDFAADLDLSFSLEGHYFLRNHESGTETSCNNNYFKSNSGFFFLSKSYDKISSAFFMDKLANIIQHIMPRFKLVKSIPHAKVPILKFDCYIGRQISCDLSMSHTNSSYLMTKLFWTFSMFDERVAPLVFIVKKWAKLNELSLAKRPTNSFTSYQITALVLHFLIKYKQPVLMPIDKFVSLTDANHHYSSLNAPQFSGVFMRHQQSQINQVLDDQKLTNVNIMSDIHMLKSKFKFGNEMKLSELLHEFFLFYAKFNFGKNIVSLSWHPMNDPNKLKTNVPLFIENPFSFENGAINVSQLYLDSFKKECSNSGYLFFSFVFFLLIPIEFITFKLSNNNNIFLLFNIKIINFN
jgi:hypothetical protein